VGQCGSVESGGTELDNITMTTNDITLAEEVIMAAAGSIDYTKSNNLPSITPPPMSRSWPSGGDTLTIGSAIRNTSIGRTRPSPSRAGLINLKSGGISSTQTFSGSWNMTSGTPNSARPTRQLRTLNASPRTATRRSQSHHGHGRHAAGHQPTS
jgi:hypothetical protein